MAKLTELEELQAAIRLAVADARPSASSVEIAQALDSESPDVVAQSVLHAWKIEKLAAAIGAERAKQRREADSWFQLELALGFQKPLPNRVRVRSGELVDYSDLTLTQARQRRADERNKQSRAFLRADLVVRIMEKHSDHGKLRLTWGEASALEAQAVVQAGGDVGGGAAAKKAAFKRKAGKAK